MGLDWVGLDWIGVDWIGVWVCLCVSVIENV